MPAVAFIHPAGMLMQAVLPAGAYWVEEHATGVEVMLAHALSILKVRTLLEELLTYQLGKLYSSTAE